MNKTTMNKMHFTSELHLIRLAHDGGSWRVLTVERIELLATGEESVFLPFQSMVNQAKSELSPATWENYADGCGKYIEEMANHGDHRRALNTALKVAELLPLMTAGTTSASPSPDSDPDLNVADRRPAESLSGFWHDMVRPRRRH